MGAISFRNRVLLVLLLLGVVPTSIAVVAVAVSLRRNNPTAAASAALRPVAATGRAMLRAVDITHLTIEERRLYLVHADSLNRAMSRTGFAREFSRRLGPLWTTIVVILGSVFLYVTWRLSLTLSRQLSRPIDELVGWTDHIRRHEPLPRDSLVGTGGAPEFAALREALRDMAAELRQARVAELEAERLRAFREVARRVAHEMKNPLTPVRLATQQLERTAGPEQRESLDVLSAEVGRLEQLAKDFSNLGRLPEGPSAEVDVGELLAELLRTSLPDTMTARLAVAPGLPHILGHYDPLRRAFANLLRNAVEACHGSGTIDVSVERDGTGVRVTLADHGVGIPEAKRGQIFAPYYTEKPDGTGLGLAIVKQSIDLHRGIIEVRDTPGGGATFIVRFPSPGAADGPPGAPAAAPGGEEPSA